MIGRGTIFTTIRIEIRVSLRRDNSENMLVWSLVLLIAFLGAVLGNVKKEDLQAKLTTALATSKASIESIRKEWQVDKYPLFLKSCFMHKSSWEVMKWKYMSKILQSAINQKNEKFVISFTGR